jgi:hypothetical protein
VGLPIPLHEGGREKFFDLISYHTCIGVHEKIMISVTPEELRTIGEQLVSRLRKEMTQDERQFIVSVKEGKPQRDLLGVPGIESLPAVQWKLLNIGRMTQGKHRDYLGV